MLGTDFKRTEIGEIPDDWDVARLGDENIAKIVMGQSPPSSTYNEMGEGLPFLQGNAEFGETYPTPRVHTRTPLKIAEKGDILISVRAPVGELNLSPDRCCIGRGLSAIRPNPSRLDHLFVFYYLRHATKRLLALATGSTFTAVRKEDLASFLVALPPLPEQSKIASVLSTVDDAIAKTDEIVAKTQQLKKGLMQRLLTRGIGHAKFKVTEIGSIPETWDVVPVGNLGQVITGSTPPTSVRDYYGNDYLFVSPADLGRSKEVNSTKKRLSKRGLDIARPIPPGSVLVTCISSLDGIGKVGMSSRECATNQQINSVICGQENDPDFLYYCLDYHRKRVQAFAARSTGHFVIITKGAFENLLMPKPPRPEQAKIGAVLSVLDAKLGECRQSVQLLHKMKLGLMQVLLTGKVRVKVD